MYYLPDLQYNLILLEVVECVHTVHLSNALSLRTKAFQHQQQSKLCYGLSFCTVHFPPSLDWLYWLLAGWPGVRSWAGATLPHVLLPSVL